MKISDLQNVVQLNDYVVLDAIGPDALTFLQGQLTADLETLSGNAVFGGYCGANGRLLATALLWQYPDDDTRFGLLLHKSLGEPLLKRLSMFVFRAKLKLSLRDAHVYGAYEPQEGTLVAKLYKVTLNEGVTAVQAPSGENEPGRWWLISDDALNSASDSADDAQQWDAETLIQGVPHIQGATQDTFIPQTLNLELIGGISFGKGCFPGQEVVARSHYRGTIRRRSALFTLPATELLTPGKLEIGTDLYAAEGTDSPAGRIINYAKQGDRYVVLAEVMLAELADTQYCLAEPTGPRLDKLQLNYDIFEQRENVRPKL
ncbi:folate-binding protein [Paenalcaligenes niemegkensis]|uniref:CAF17-like 4Fe-4S cluster assembly/insertion protein YgfZ n=1 Tax=Paenalcaligenes niemegkensis TaxID=2895469 RepID=UPI001EE7C06C|nr:folate-binding protein [Paenalcaligenes niemegkensis]MCQ9616304.1 folate-binding protein [Paenalcaligenes niemegkensis]